MTICQAIKSFPQQFAYQPMIHHRALLKKHMRYLVVGMGGSLHAHDLIKAWNPGLDSIGHRDYGLPPLPKKELKERLVILSSYSGNTEEVLDAFSVAQRQKLPLAVISTGGKLLRLAKHEKIPYIQMPSTGIEPRMALGFSLRAMMRLMNQEKGLAETATLAKNLVPLEQEPAGADLAKQLQGFVPIIYASSHNSALGNCWKIKFNETGKIPAFANVFPELNHNEMNGFQAKPRPEKLLTKFACLILKDAADHPRILKRMEVLEKLYRDRGVPVYVISLQGETILHKIFSSLVLADWTSYYIAKLYGVSPGGIPMVEEFKKLIQ